MKKFGLIGGTSWHSTVEYYTGINRAINQWHGDNTNPRLQIASLNQKQLHDLQRSGDWDSIADLFIEAGLELQGTGVQGLSLCANTPHKIYDQLQASLDIPVLHIADAVASSQQQQRWQKIGLIGTRFTMEEDFIKGRLEAMHGVEALVPSASVQGEIQTLIYEKLSVGIFDDDTKLFFREVIDSLAEAGAQAVILGCTEFPLLLKNSSSRVLLIDSVKCHCEMIVRFILGDGKPSDANSI